jgi:hypothetical protein
MLVKLLEEGKNKEFVKCPKDNSKYYNPYCRKECVLFKGYKTTDDGQRNVICKYNK